MFELRTRLLARGGRGSFFRDDVEASDRELEPGNADLSKIYEFGTQNRELTTYTTVRLMRYIERFSSVRTNRLHICIAAALLGKAVDFYPNSYFKNKAVYEYSLRERFSNVRWHDK
jgi:exopolysaccharide biosynthesis predicted pyruvyltransferase EpsI